jgi:hypothetical protein
MKLTKAKTEEVKGLIMQGHSILQACNEAQVSRATLYRKMNEDEELANEIATAQRQSAEKALEDVETMYVDILSGAKKYDPNVLRDYATHIRWKVSKVLPERFGDAKSKAGVEINDGSIRIVWENE